MTSSNSNIQRQEHESWTKSVDNWLDEIQLLKGKLKQLSHNQVDEKTKAKARKYQNHLEHNKRFLNEIIGHIRSHEQFLHEFDEMGMDTGFGDVEQTHLKTQDHIKDFEKRFGKLRKKINKIT